MAASALEGVRVVEFDDETGSYCGRLFADLGAEVIKVEPPQGGRERHTPPFIVSAGENVDTSLGFWVHNTSKKSVVLDLDDPTDRDRAQKLALTADIVVEDFAVGYLAARGLGYEELKASRPALVYASITGFGQDGPHAGWAYSDIIGQAVGGIMTLAGDPADPPNRIYGNQANVSASIHAAYGALLALRRAEATGAGQLVDVSAQESVSISQEIAMMTWDFQKVNKVRLGISGSLPLPLPGIGAYEAADGHVLLFILAPGGAEFPVLVDWMREKGMAEDLDDEPFATLCNGLNMQMLTALMGGQLDDIQAQIANLSHINDVVRRFIKTLPAREAYEEGQSRTLLVGLVSTPADLAQNAQLRARDWYIKLDVDGDTTIEFPGPPYRLSRTPAAIARPPRLGEHTEEILASL
ncbi:MAG: CaiB/BaiF CoA transferase family protein [Dehalococcoidia bacterium]